MARAGDDYVYDEASGEWVVAGVVADAAAAAAKAGVAVEVRDAVGNLLATVTR